MDRASFLCVCVWTFYTFQILLLKLMLSNNIYISQCFHIKTDGKIHVLRERHCFP